MQKRFFNYFACIHPICCQSCRESRKIIRPSQLLSHHHSALATIYLIKKPSCKYKRLYLKGNDHHYYWRFLPHFSVKHHGLWEDYGKVSYSRKPSCKQFAPAIPGFPKSKWKPLPNQFSEQTGCFQGVFNLFPKSSQGANTLKQYWKYFNIFHFFTIFFGFGIMGIEKSKKSNHKQSRFLQDTQSRYPIKVPNQGTNIFMIFGASKNQKSQGANTKVDGHPQIALRPESLLATLAT